MVLDEDERGVIFEEGEQSGSSLATDEALIPSIRRGSVQVLRQRHVVLQH